MLRNLISIGALALILAGCGGGGGGGASVNTGSGTGTVTPATQGVRILGMDVKEIPAVTYDIAYQQAAGIGVREVSVSLDWAELEPTVGNYDNNLPGIIEAYYPLQAGDLTLVLRPLDTPGPSLPAGLAGLPYDDPAVIAAFENFLSNLHAQLPTLNASGKLRWIHIGNEIDAYLGTDALRWAQWQSFYQAAVARVRALWGNAVEVSSIVQFSVLDDPASQALYFDLLSGLDNAVLTYYPLNSDFTMQPVSAVASDFDLMVNEITAKPIILQECGYASSALNNSSEAQQAAFVTAVFEAWDRHRDRIPLVDFAWQYDVASTEVDQWVIDFGMTGHPDEAAFRAYLGSIGLANYDSTEKQAMQQLRDELNTRDWVN